MAKTPQEQVSDLTNGMMGVLLGLEGVRGVVVVVDWDDPKNPHLGCFRVKETSLSNVLDLLKRSALMQSHMLTTVNRLTTPKKETPSDPRPDVPGSPEVVPTSTPK